MGSKKEIKFYSRLNYSPLLVTEKDIASYLPYMRTNPRFAEIITEHIRDFWWKYDAQLLVKKSKELNRLKVLVEMVAIYCEDQTPEFIKWKDVVLKAPSKVRVRKEPFFKLNSFFDKKQIEGSIEVYEKHGFFGDERLFNKDNPKVIGTREKNRLRYLDKIKLQEVERLLKIIKDNNLSREDVMKKLSTDKTTVSHLMNKKVHHISLDFIVDKIGDFKSMGLCQEG